MPLIDLELPEVSDSLPAEVREFLRVASRRIRRFQRDVRVPGFVPGDYRQVYHALRALAAADVAPGRLFCEWGSGFGVVTCLAAMLEFDAVGIEVEAELIDAARRLAADFDIPAEFAHGSYLPRGCHASGEFAWLDTDAPDAHVELGLDPDDFSVIFAYPWPDEEGLAERLFERYASAGAILLSHHGGSDMRVRRKKSAGRGKPKTAKPA